MSDMVQYSQKTALMSPTELRDFVTDYHHKLVSLIDTPENAPVDIEPSGGDGALAIFNKQPNESDDIICTRAAQSALTMARAVASRSLAPTRVGIYLGKVIESELCGRRVKFGTSFSIANRLEELCGHFGTVLLMDRSVASRQRLDRQYLVNIGKFSLLSVPHPINAYTLYKPGIHQIPIDVSGKELLTFIRMKNEAMDHFSGNFNSGQLPDFPKTRNILTEAQNCFFDMTGQEDIATARILEFIRENPHPGPDFNSCGMMLMRKQREIVKNRLFHLSKELFKAMDKEIYHALMIDTSWEQYFKLEWFKKGSTIINEGDAPDGIYYLDTGIARTYDKQKNLLSTLKEGEIFGEMAYFGRRRRRTATVIAESDVVALKISSKDLQRFPAIKKIFKRIAESRAAELAFAAD